MMHGDDKLHLFPYLILQFVWSAWYVSLLHSLIWSESSGFNDGQQRAHLTVLVENDTSFSDLLTLFCSFRDYIWQWKHLLQNIVLSLRPQTAGDRNIKFCFLPVCRMNNESVNSEREWECGMTQAKYLQFFHQKSLSFLSPIVIMISVMILASSSAVWCDLCDFLRVIVSFYRVILTMLSQNFVFLIFTSFLGRQKKYVHNFHSWLYWMSTKYQ